MRLPLAMLEVFNAIAQNGSLKGAAVALGIKPSTVSHQLKSLEEQLGTALFVRTTRSVTLTDAGRALQSGAGAAFDLLGQAVKDAKDHGSSARGSLRLTLPEFVFHSFLADLLSSFQEAYPEIQLELSLSDAIVDIVADGLHGGLRLGGMIAQDMIAIRLSNPQPLTVLGSKAYLDKHGRPEKPEDLLAHNCLQYRFQTSGQLAPWVFRLDGDRVEIDVQGGLILNTLPAQLQLMEQGMGLVLTFRDYALINCDLTKVECLLEDYLKPVDPIYLFYPREYKNLQPLRLFIDHIKTHRQLS
ncbi:transcriptional regulator, LysR family [Pseudovibrio ascidiaceicola]|uniref:Transcriptional regulator, LysR family n=1 Tax=Pseudovibrio ascidiaceicola TaxID=285279 RepID=A0A1I3ZFP5_9HYPH|nr:LysR family transcriptional regulator [Pseudovibrio ascidiaceicola]SFK42875.1 transcriptional regulator, LysR family [Pseudovibrio ascidiaceicola]